jgi:large subunit ribosomal protein L19
MRNRLIEVVEKKYQKSEKSQFDIGDDVVVTLRISEGGKSRLQDFSGTVVARRGAGMSEMFTVRRLVGDEGVERIFPLHSPHIVSIKGVRSGKIRRAKLYFLRERVGKSRKLTEKRVTAEQKAAAEKARSSKARSEMQAGEIAARAKEAAAVGASS